MTGLTTSRRFIALLEEAPMLRRTIGLAWVLVALNAGSLQAQRLVRETTDSVVPRELFDATFNMTVPFGPARVFAGKIPPALTEQFYVPPSSRIIGSVENRVVTIVIINVPLSVDSAIASYRRELPRLGWTPTSPPPSSRTWGFLPARGNRPEDQRKLDFCRDGRQLGLAIGPRQSGDSAKVLVSIIRTPCGPADASRAAFAANPYAEAPILVNPSGAGGRLGASCERQGRSGGSSHPSTALRTAMTPKEILGHYGRQLSDSGWTQVASTDDIARTTWQRTDSSGARLEVTLTVATHAGTPGCRDVEMLYMGRHP